MPDKYTIEQVVEMVARQDRITGGRRKRQDFDYGLQRGDAYNTNVDSEGSVAGTDFRSFTANEAGAFVRKIVSILTAAQLGVQVPYGAAQRDQRGRYDLKERYGLGCLEQADDLLGQIIEPGVLDQLVWFACVRGWVSVRALLQNRADATSFASARPWDPRNVYWEVGSEGLLWVCHRSARPAVEVLATYPRANLNVSEDDEPVIVYDVYTPKMNGVMTEDNMLKKWLVHGSPRVPVIIRPLPTQPLIWAQVGDTFMAGQPDSVDDYGESILATNRHLYPHLNEVLSIALELMSKAREPSSVVFTDEEDTELAADPNRRGGVHYLSREDKLQQLAPPETTRDATQFFAAVVGMLQRGAIPYSSYGELSHPISGYAITQLNQQVLTVVDPVARTVAEAIRGVLDLWVDQFVTDGLNPMTVR